MHARLFLVLSAFSLTIAGASTSSYAATPHAHYPRAAVQPVSVRPLADGMIALRYRVPPESAYYSAGVDYEDAGDTLRVVITRCSVGAPCAPMARSVLALDADWQAEVHLPYHRGPVLILHVDGQQQIDP